MNTIRRGEPFGFKKKIDDELQKAIKEQESQIINESAKSTENIVDNQANKM